MTTIRTAGKLSTGNSKLPNQPQPVLSRHWWVVRYCHLLNALDSTTLRQEPVQGHPLKSRSPLTFPWVYFPDRTGLTSSPPHTVKWLNRAITFPVVTLLDVRELADILSRVGGVVIQQVARNLTGGDDGQPTGEIVSTGKKKYATHRQPLTSRHRGQTQRYTKQLSSGRSLAALATSSQQLRHRNGVLPVHDPRPAVRPLPDHADTLHRPGHLRIAEEFQITGQEAEDELRRWLGIHTYAEEIVIALGLKDERECV